MVPIGVVTYNRPTYLDVTLRSLSATELPEQLSLTVYDDASSHPAAKHYLYTNRPLAGQKRDWPMGPAWKTSGLDIINRVNPRPVGIKDRVAVHQLGGQPQGVVNASCAAFRHLFETHPEAPGAILLQDDVIFNYDWYTRLVAARRTLLGDKPLGLLSGIRLNRSIRPLPKQACVLPAASTAQCLYLSREAYELLRGGWLGKHHKLRQKFDDHLCVAVSKAGLGVGLMFPFVCQHMGMLSLVRPSRKWTGLGRRKGRVGYYSQPPYVLAPAVKSFLQGAACV